MKPSRKTRTSTQKGLNQPFGPASSSLKAGEVKAPYTFVQSFKNCSKPPSKPYSPPIPQQPPLHCKALRAIFCFSPKSNKQPRRFHGLGSSTRLERLGVHGFGCKSCRASGPAYFLGAWPGVGAWGMADWGFYGSELCFPEMGLVGDHFEKSTVWGSGLRASLPGVGGS